MSTCRVKGGCEFRQYNYSSTDCLGSGASRLVRGHLPTHCLYLEVHFSWRQMYWEDNAHSTLDDFSSLIEHIIPSPCARSYFVKQSLNDGYTQLGFIMYMKSPKCVLFSAHNEKRYYTYIYKITYPQRKRKLPTSPKSTLWL